MPEDHSVDTLAYFLVFSWLLIDTVSIETIEWSDGMMIMNVERFVG
jgi:hypothetical protein